MSDKIKQLEASNKKLLKQVQEKERIIAEMKEKEFDIVKYVKEKMNVEKSDYVEYEPEIEKELFNAVFSFPLSKTMSREQKRRVYIECIIEEVIAYYNDRCEPDSDKSREKKYFFIVDSDCEVITIYNNSFNKSQKSTLYMKSAEVAEKAKEVLTNWNGKDILTEYSKG